MSEEIKKMFDEIAKNYDRLNDIISFKAHSKTRHQAIKNVALKPDAKVLDVCCGTGDIAIYLAKNVVKTGKVTGIDFSKNMLELAKKKAKEIKNIEFIEGDALNLPFRDNEFDACFISFGLRNLDNLEKGLQEMKRVTKEGGFVVSLDMGKPHGPLKFFYNLFLFKIIPILGAIFCAKFKAYKYLPESTKKFPPPEELVKIFEQVGLKNVKRFDFLFGAISQQIGQV